MLSLGFGLTAGLLPTTQVQAADGTWTNGNSNNIWQDDGNWSASPFPGTAGNTYGSQQTATFSTTGTGTIDLGGVLNIRDIRLGAGAGDSNAFIIGDANDTLNLSNASTPGTNGIILVGTGVTTSQQIGVSGTTIRLSTTNTSQYHFTNNSTTAAAQLLIAGNVSTATATGPSVLTLNGSNGGTVSGIIANGGAQALAVTKAGTGTWTLNNANTYSGATVVTGGVLNLTAGTIGAITNNVGISVGFATGAQTSALRQSGGTLASGGTAAQTIIGSTGSGGYGAYELSGGTFSYTTDASGTGRVGLRNGQLTQTGGAINVSYTSTGGLTASAFTVGNNSGDRGRVYATAGTATIATGARTGIAVAVGNTSGSNGDLTIAGTADWALTGTAGVVSLSVVSGATGNLNLNGTGRLTAIRVADGGGTGRISFDGGTLKAGASTASFLTGLDSARIYAGGATIDTDVNNITIGQALLAPTGEVVESIALGSGGSGYIGAPQVLISGGTGNGATAVANYDAVTGAVTGFTMTSLGSGYTAGDVLTVSLSGGFQTGGTAATAGSVTLAAAPTTGGLTKVGSGSLTLTAANTYSGTTTVSAGTLLANNTTGSALGTANVVVNGGILGGTGSFNGAVAINAGGTLAPGAGIESLATGAVSFAANSSFAYELNTSSLNGDFAKVNGNLTIDSAALLGFTETSPGTVALGSKLTLINYNGIWNGAGFSGYADDSTFALGSNSWLINYNDTTGGTNFVADQFGGSSNFVTLTAVAAIPEPGTWALLMLGGVGGCLLRRKRT